MSVRKLSLTGGSAGGWGAGMERNGPVQGLFKRRNIHDMVPKVGLGKDNKNGPQVSNLGK